MGNTKSRLNLKGVQNYIRNITSRGTELEVTCIKDLPNEVIQKNIMKYLSNYDIRSFGMTGNKRFKVIADDELEKRRK